jgi:hypothetical protein
MKDIDRNINSILYSKINSLESRVFNIDFSKYKIVYTRRVDVNIDDTQTTKSTVKRLAFPIQVTLDAGDYYYLHTLQPVSSDNTQCLFSLSLQNSVSTPFFSYYAQSPIEDSNGEIYYGHNFAIIEKSNIFVSRNNPVLPSFKMKSVIRIYRKV